MKSRTNSRKSLKNSSKKSGPSSRKNNSKTKKAPLRKTKIPVLGKIKKIKTSKEATNYFSKTPKVIVETSQKVQASKYDLGIAVKEADHEAFRLPLRYFDNRIVAMTRDPWWLHTYWDIAKEKEEEVIAKIPDDERNGLKRVLRVYDVSGIKHFTGFNANSFFDVEINDVALNWYINVNKPGCSFCIDIGFLSHKGNFYLLARSNIISTPVFGISSVLDEEWVLPDEDYFKILGIYDLGRSSLERRRKFEEIFRRQISSFAGSEAFSPVKREKMRQFFLEVYTELILYGRTVPDANVTLKGKKVNLRKDGTFSFRFALPIGNFDFPVEAKSSDGKDTLRSTPIVKRTQK